MKTSDIATHSVVLVDAHVHLHPMFRTGEFFDHAAENFSDVRGCLEMPADACGCLLLTECAGADRFTAMRDGADPTLGGWRVRRAQEPCSLVVERSGARLIVVAGRQVVTRERLEVLALGTTNQFDDGGPIDDVVAGVRMAGALPVIPWGFGKWAGERGHVLEGLLEKSGKRICLGDNGGRLRYGPEPTLLSQARRRGIPVLPGSDPLPFADHIRRAGTYGFVLRHQVDEARPMNAIREAIEAGEVGESFGQRAGFCAFAKAQLGMQLRQRLGWRVGRGGVA